MTIDPKCGEWLRAVWLLNLCRRLPSSDTLRAELEPVLVARLGAAAGGVRKTAWLLPDGAQAVRPAARRATRQRE
jgi:hypothetical protein